MRTRVTYVKALTLEGTIAYYTKKNNLYKKDGKFNVISVGGVCKCAGLLYERPDPYSEITTLRDRATGDYLEITNTGDVATDVTTIWNMSKEILYNEEMKKELEKYNI